MNDTLEEYIEGLLDERAADQKYIKAVEAQLGMAITRIGELEDQLQQLWGKP